MKFNLLPAVGPQTTVACCVFLVGLCLVIISYIPNDRKHVTLRNPSKMVFRHATGEVTLISPRYDSIQIGDILHYHIHSNLTDSGGEFYEAKLTSKVNPQASTAGHFVDHANGTYSVYFYAGWGGGANVSITRVLKREAVTFLNDIVWNAEDRVVWRGYFDVDGASGNLTAMPSGLCKLRNSGNWSERCVYPHRKALGSTVFLCEKLPGVDCNSLWAVKSDDNMIQKKATELMIGKETLFDKNQDYRQLIVADSTITISGTPRPASSKPKLHRCLPDQKLPLSHGYWFEGHWISLICQITDWTSPGKLSSCLRNKNLILLGDSTTRQWLEVIYKLLFRSNLKRGPTDKFFTLRQYYSSLNATILFTAPPQLIGSLVVSVEEVNYEVDVLDGLNDSYCNYIILVSPWAHFTQWVRSYYEERMQLVREALLRFRKVCPNAKIVLKGAHAREHKTTSSVVYSSDFFLKKIDQINRKALSGIGVLYLPIWAMNMAYPTRNTIHMPVPVILEELKMFFSYVCES